MVKNILSVVFCFLVVFLMVFMTVEAYPKERCGRILSQLQDKQRNPSLYPGFRLTDDIKWACPGIEHKLK